MKVMVLDDNAQILMMVTTMLHSAFGQDDCEVVSGRNGQNDVGTSRHHSDQLEDAADGRHDLCERGASQYSLG